MGFCARAAPLKQQVRGGQRTLRLEDDEGDDAPAQPQHISTLGLWALAILVACSGIMADGSAYIIPFVGNELCQAISAWRMCPRGLEGIAGPGAK